MSLGGIGLVLILFGLGALLMALINLASNALPPRSQRLDLIKKKKEKNESLSKQESLEEQQYSFERKFPVIGVVCLLAGLFLVNFD
jgi:hypothetical protein